MGTARRINRISAFYPDASSASLYQSGAEPRGFYRASNAGRPQSVSNPFGPSATEPTPLSSNHRLGGPSAALAASVALSVSSATMILAGVAGLLGFTITISPAAVLATLGLLGVVCGLLTMYSASIALIVAGDDVLDKHDRQAKATKNQITSS
ncbi:hypothetical protein [Pseudobythopirellula maris]|uniref:hypothetical protein n=1 Tax=Pseudobythopirellula maris TaxID=2527991 RepID=UPI0011B5A272|nr:hypothetical protein [Pseudobythopirellula maris]